MALTLTRQSSITLQYPYLSPTSTLTLKNPILESTYSQYVKHLYKKTRGLTPKMYRDNQWPEFIKLFVITQGATVSHVNTYHNLILATAGKELKYTDQDGLIYKVFLFPGEVTQQYRSCGYVIKFELEGERV
jgi:hypothetical protein